MMNATKTLPIVIPAVLGIGIATAVFSGRPPRERNATIPAGTTLVVALEQAVSTQASHVGDAIELRTVQPLRLGNGAEIPEGSLIAGRVTDARSGSRYAGPPELGMRFTELKIDGDTHEISTEQFRFGTLGRATQNDQIVLPAGRRIMIRLSRPVAVESRPAPEQARAAEYRRLGKSVLNPPVTRGDVDLSAPVARAAYGCAPWPCARSDLATRPIPAASSPRMTNVS